MTYLSRYFRASKFCAYGILAWSSAIHLADAHPFLKPSSGKAAPIPKYQPARVPVVTGEFVVGVINIVFKDTVFPQNIQAAISDLENVTDTSLEEDPSIGNQKRSNPKGIKQDEYFKIYSNDIAWPKLVFIPNEKTYFQDTNFYGYYCRFDVDRNPFGWKTLPEAEQRVKQLRQRALVFAASKYTGPKPRFLCCNHITHRTQTPSKSLTATLFSMYPKILNSDDMSSSNQALIKKGRQLSCSEKEIWPIYQPIRQWGEPAWPNSSILIDDFAGGVLAHELGHCLGAPDVYRVGRYDDGIGGQASLYSYGPTANAFSRFYHHAYIKEENHPTIKQSGTYTLHPRHIKPSGDQAVGYLIPSNHPHYMYHVEYLHQENDFVGYGSKGEGMLISVINLGRDNYLGSPDFFYTYRPNDPFFRGLGQANRCLFGKMHGRQEFSMTTEPSSRLPNLLDGGVVFKNIEEKNGTLTFDVTIEKKTITGAEYDLSMLPQIRMDKVFDIQATSFTMDCTIKFRGEPLKTMYGFCWETTKNPTIHNANYALAHRECYRGHALHLKPDTTYYVRAFAKNDLGIRYSDEEITVKTADEKSPPAKVGPLLTDEFARNTYLSTRYSDQTPHRYVDYSMICTIARLMAYYRPATIRKSVVDFNMMHWNPTYDDPPARLGQAHNLFNYVFQGATKLRLNQADPENQLMENFSKLTGIKSKMEMTELKDDNPEELSELIKADLRQSRPVVMIIAKIPQTGDFEPVRWILIDGMNEKGEFFSESPGGVVFVEDGSPYMMPTGYYPLEKWSMTNYRTHIITSCYYQK